ncbi:unnamed protein product, partial [Effrenium voratum]
GSGPAADPAEAAEAPGLRGRSTGAPGLAAQLRRAGAGRQGGEPFGPRDLRGGRLACGGDCDWHRLPGRVVHARSDGTQGVLPELCQLVRHNPSLSQPGGGISSDPLRRRLQLGPNCPHAAPTAGAEGSEAVPRAAAVAQGVPVLPAELVLVHGAALGVFAHHGTGPRPLAQGVHRRRTRRLRRPPSGRIFSAAPRCRRLRVPPFFGVAVKGGREAVFCFLFFA